MPQYTALYILGNPLDLEVAEYEPDIENIRQLTQRMKPEATDDEDARRKAKHRANRWNDANQSEPDRMKILAILDEHGKSLKRRKSSHHSKEGDDGQGDA